MTPNAIVLKPSQKQLINFVFHHILVDLVKYHLNHTQKKETINR